ncbi:tyrosine protein kinase [Vibrio hyugaensis]|uniref:Tyrosine protein kinase n=1 Tax=Vibrio hyugaensis TaxID=1534743 RepID=A0ABQ5Y613_9VIBR|nr:polysaccharide biosynthesis tyrosine autokinase [Vibrio hyugaensis]GLR05479.1 tyrosine protein kinase [Vibrio hyugaensis]
MSTQKTPEIIDLNKLVGIILDSKKSIAASTLLCASIGVGYAILSIPVYKADALIQVEEKASGMAALGEMSEMFATEGRSSTEIELLKSRMVLGDTVDKLGLTTVVTPKTLPVIGAGIDRLSGVNKFANLSTFDAPVGNYHLVIERNVASLYNEFDQLILAGRVGEAMTNTDADISMKIESASVDGEFAVTKVTRRQAINDLKQSFSVSELGKQTGMLSLSVTGHNKAHLENVLDTISNSYVNQNIERNAQEAKNSLAFLQKHMPTVKETLTIAENKLNAYRLENDSVDLGLEAKSTLDVIVGIEQQLNELTFKESEISQRFTQSHPSYVALIEKRQTLLSERERFNQMVQKLPKTQREVLRLTRDVEVNQSIYLSMLNKVQELSVVQASTVGNVRLVDEANSIDQAVKPKKALIALASALFGFLFGSGIALVRSIMNKGITSPEELDQISMPVYATIPLSEEQSKLEKRKGKKLIAKSNPTDLSVEAIRSLRTALHFAMFEAKNNVVMITGSSPGVGKSFVSANLAKVISESGKKVLLIDSDMRRGTSDKYCGLDNEIGLSDLLSKSCFDIEDAIQRVTEKFHVITRGTTPPNPSELLMNPLFSELVGLVQENYDHVIIDTPPILAVTDAAIVGQLCGTSLMVGRFEQTSLKEVEAAKERFEQNGVNIKGFVLNGMIKRAVGYGYEYNYGYESK